MNHAKLKYLKHSFMYRNSLLHLLYFFSDSNLASWFLNMPAKSKKIVKVSQEDLRKLMKQKTQAKKVESSYAKYNK